VDVIKSIYAGVNTVVDLKVCKVGGINYGCH